MYYVGLYVHDRSAIIKLLDEIPIVDVGEVVDAETIDMVVRHPELRISHTNSRAAKQLSPTHFVPFPSHAREIAGNRAPV
jgi:hypothetical protein